MSPRSIATTIGLAGLCVASITIAAPSAKSPASTSVRVYTAHRSVQACLPRSTGELLVATRGGLVRLDRERRVQQTLTRVTGLPGTRVYAVLAHGARLIVATEGGVALVARDTRGALRVTARRPGRDVRALAVQGDRLILGTWGAGVQALPLRAIDAGRLPKPRLLTTTVPMPGLRVTTLYAHRGEILVGSAGRGIWVLPKVGRTLAPHAASSHLPSPFVWAIAMQRGHLVVATLAGLVEQRRNPRHPWHVLSSADIRALVPDKKGALLVAGFGRGIGRLASSPTATIRWSAQGGAYITALGHSAQTICGGGDRGAFELAAGALRHFGRADGLPHEHVHSLLTLRDGHVVAGTGRGLAIFSGPKGDRVDTINLKQGLPVASVWALAETHDATGRILWVGTSRGLYRWSLTRRRYERFSVASGHLTDDWVTALTVNRNIVYVGTYNAGIVRLSPEAPSRGLKGARYKATSLGGGWINFAGLRLLRHKGRTWLLAATMNGVEAAPFDMKSSAATPRPHVLAHPAALGRDVTALLPGVDGKHLWIASRRGLVRHPLTILPKPRDPNGC
ncbi:MAG: hypothetical protein KAI47_25580 [Deltaproteobacteria bacterium]|nr:hypothetical protein [Deltaproteobacteria bacterium]